MGEKIIFLHNKKWILELEILQNSPIPLNLVNDIALLELAEELDLEVYTPVCLAETGLNEAGNKCCKIYHSKYVYE